MEADSWQASVLSKVTESYLQAFISHCNQILQVNKTLQKRNRVSVWDPWRLFQRASYLWGPLTWSLTTSTVVKFLVGFVLPWLTWLSNRVWRLPTQTVSICSKGMGGAIEERKTAQRQECHCLWKSLSPGWTSKPMGWHERDISLSLLRSCLFLRSLD